MNKNCEGLHEILNSLKRLKIPFDSEDIPQDGLYFLFEKGELGHNGDRIVRIGTHRGNGNLKARLREHFLVENKDRSIFRKNIGRALLNRENDDYLKLWELDLTTRANKDKYFPIIDIEYQRMIENRITKYIQEMFSFVVIEVKDKERRLNVEKKIIAEVSNCNKCGSSTDWLGRYSTKEKIKNSGLWQVNELNKEGFSKEEFLEFKNLI